MLLSDKLQLCTYGANVISVLPYDLTLGDK